MKVSRKKEQTQTAIPLEVRITCPHCWNVFPPDRALWIAQHPDLLGDSRLGADHAQRFLPTRFTLEGAAVDRQGFACHELACPNCHLSVPRAMFEMKSSFLSILGGPACGKSYFLASMTWRLRKLLPQRFALGFNDADPALNHRRQEYESLQFLNPNQDAPVAIEKTEAQGDLYDTVLFGEQAISYPRPFVFSIGPLEKHPHFEQARKTSHALCLYDNAGESFLPGEDTATSPVTRHLASSQALMFLFDPTQDMRFRQACSGKTDDPQMKERSECLDRERPVRQETILAEAAQRVRRYAGLGQREKHGRPLLMIVTKFDCWSSLLGMTKLPSPCVTNSDGSQSALDMGVLEKLSKRVRAVLWKLCPEVVATAESFAAEVTYIPVSATGCSPEVDPETGAMGIRPRNIDPQWAEVPILYIMSRWMRGLIPYTNRSTRSVRAKNRPEPWSNGPNGEADGESHQTADEEAS